MLTNINLNAWRFRLLITVFLFALPVAALLWVVDQVDQDGWNARQETLREDLHQIVAHFARLSQVTFFYQESMDRLKRSLIWGGDPLTVLSSLPKGSVKCYAFSAGGKRVKLPGFQEGMVFASEKCLQMILRVARQKGRRLTEKEKNLADSFLGSSEAIGILAEHPGKMNNLEAIGVDRLAGIFPYRSKKRGGGYFIAWVPSPGADPREGGRKPLPIELGTLALKRIQKLAGPEFGFGLIDLRGAHAEQLSGIASLPARIREIVYSPADERFIGVQGKIWSLNPLSRRYLVLGTRSDLPPLEPLFDRYPALGRCLVGGLILLLLLQQAMISRGVPIRLQVGLLFALASVGSILSLLGFGSAYIEIRKKNLLRERREQVREVLEKVDSSFPLYQDRWAQRYRLFFRRFAQHLDEERLFQHVRPKKVNLPAGISIMAFDPQGKFLFHQRSEAEAWLVDLLGSDALLTMSRGGKMAIRLFNLFSTVGYKTGDAEYASASRVAQKIGDKWYEYRGRVYEVVFGGKAVTFFFDLLMGKENQPKVAVVVTHLRDQIQRAYLASVSRRLRKFEFFDRYPVRVVFQKKSAFRPGKNPALPWNSLKGLNDLVSQIQGPVSREISWGQETYFLMGIPGKHLGDYNLLLVSSLKSVWMEAIRLSRGFLGCSLLILLFALGLSYVFAQLLLDPIHRLTRSLEKLSRSDFSSDPSLQTGDEFQVIGEGVQEILEEMKELAIARTIQEHLIPREPLRIGPWKCQGWTRSSSEIGGELFDYLELPDHRLLFYLTAVPGHSIGSALILAMTKMGVQTLAEVRSPDPLELLRALDDRLLSRIQGAAKHPFLLGVLDQDQGTLALVGRGAFLWGTSSPRGEVSCIRKDGSSGGDPGFPELFQESIALGPGERLCFLSPGSWDPALPDERVKNLVATLFLRLSTETDQAPLLSESTDSQTVLLLERGAP